MHRKKKARSVARLFCWFFRGAFSLIYKDILDPALRHSDKEIFRDGKKDTSSGSKRFFPFHDLFVQLDQYGCPLWKFSRRNAVSRHSSGLVAKVIKRKGKKFNANMKRVKIEDPLSLSKS